MKKIGVILAGGDGKRFGDILPKQFFKLAGREIIEYTVDVFQKSENIDEIFIVSKLQYENHIWELSRQNNWTKLSKVVVAGPDRMGSTESAVAAFSGHDENTNLLFHDAVRPLLDDDLIHRCVRALEEFAAVDVVMSSADTLVTIRDDGCIADIPARSLMRRGQTPQAFRLHVIREALERANRLKRRDFTCDCSVVRFMLPNVPITTVEGSEANIKITSKLDLFLAEKLIQSRTLKIKSKEIKTILGKTVVVFGGNSGIGESIRKLALLNGAQVFSASRSTNGVDVTDADAVEKFLADIAGRVEQIDAIVNSAGTLIRRPFMQMGYDEINLLIKTNYLGAVNVARAAHFHLAHSRGTLVNFASSSYTRGRAQYAIYSSSKCAVVNLTQALAEEWHGEGINVICISPERTNTPMRKLNFGKEDPASLLSPELVARYTLAAITMGHTGVVLDVKR